MEYDAVISEFTKVFPTCPICGSNSGYDATRKFLTYYIRCRSCEAVWEKVVAGPIWKTELRYLARARGT
jgi:translation initiation factor 2 beta subunit (eIF-2beta)/eIF-5